MRKPPKSIQTIMLAILRHLKQKQKQSKLSENDKRVIRFVREYIQDIDCELNTSAVNMCAYVSVILNGDIRCMEHEPVTFRPYVKQFSREKYRTTHTQCTVSQPEFLKQFSNWDWTTNANEDTSNIQFTLENGSWIKLDGTFNAYPNIPSAFLTLRSDDTSTKWILKTFEKGKCIIDLSYFFYERMPSDSDSWFHVAPGSKRYARDILQGMKNTFIQMMPPGYDIIFNVNNCSKIPPKSFTSSQPNILAGVWLTPLRIVQGHQGFYEECGFYDRNDIISVNRLLRVSFRRMEKHRKIQEFRSNIQKPLSKRSERKFWESLPIPKEIIVEAKKIVA